MAEAGWFRTKLSNGWRKAKAAPLVGLGAAALIPLAFIANDFRKSRRYDPDNELPAPDLAQPLPPVLDFTPPEPPKPATLMGMPPVEGPLAQKVKLGRAGIGAGPDVTPPSITTPGGISMIDGKHVQDLKDAGTPNYATPA